MSAITAGIAAVVGLGLFAIQIIASVLATTSRAAWPAPGAVWWWRSSPVPPPSRVVNVLLAATDALSAGVVQVATGGSIDHMGARILAAGALTNVSNPAAVILLALVVVAATVVVWAALMVRKLLIIVAAVFAPIAFAGSLADITAVLGSRAGSRPWSRWWCPS